MSARYTEAEETGVETTARDLRAESYKAEQRRQWNGAAEQLRGWWPNGPGACSSPQSTGYRPEPGIQVGARGLPLLRLSTPRFPALPAIGFLPFEAPAWALGPKISG